MALIKVNNRGQSADFATPVERGLQSKNLIMNGDFRVWQRQNSGTSIALNSFGPDRWAVRGGGAMTLTSRTDYGTPKCLLAQSSSQTNVGIGQRIEAINCKRFAGQQCTISYYLRADYPAYHNLLMLYANAEDNHGGGQTPFINTAKSYSSNVVTQITHTFTMPANAANGIDVILQWYDGGAGAFNLTAFIWDIQLELGDTATEYERLDIGQQTLQCQRYFQQIGRTTGSNGMAGRLITAQNSGGTCIAGYVLPVTMYGHPSATGYGGNSTTGNVNVNYSNTSSSGAMPGFMNYISTDERAIGFNMGSTGNANGSSWIDMGNTGNAFGLELQAEL